MPYFGAIIIWKSDHTIKQSLIACYLDASGVITFSGNQFGEGTGRIWLDSFQRCTGLENKLIDCGENSSLLASCTHSQDAGMRCPDRVRSGCQSGSVRLRSGSTQREGLVEICVNNTWGTVCNSGWSSIDARVICRQLGFSVAGMSPY